MTTSTGHRYKLGQQLFIRTLQMGTDLEEQLQTIDTRGTRCVRSLGAGCRWHRPLIYVAKFHDTICVLHVFTKKSMRTPKTDIDLAKRRYREARDG